MKLSPETEAVIADARITVRCLALELPERVWDDASTRIGKALDLVGVIALTTPTPAPVEEAGAEKLPTLNTQQLLNQVAFIRQHGPSELRSESIDFGLACDWLEEHFRAALTTPATPVASDTGEAAPASLERVLEKWVDVRPGELDEGAADQFVQELALAGLQILPILHPKQAADEARDNFVKLAYAAKSRFPGLPEGYTHDDIDRLYQWGYDADDTLRLAPTMLTAATPAPSDTGEAWVSVGERLPAKGTTVWAAMLPPNNKYKVVRAFFRPDGIWDEFCPEWITHWQPYYVAEPAAPATPVASDPKLLANKVAYWLRAFAPERFENIIMAGTPMGSALAYADDLLEKCSVTPVAVDTGEATERPTPGASYCMGVDVAGLLIKGRKAYAGLVSDDNDEPLNARDTRAWLVDHLLHGRKVLPMGECDNWDAKAGCCRGHLSEPDEDSATPVIEQKGGAQA